MNSSWQFGAGAAIIALFGAVAVTSAQAQDAFPSRSIKMMVPFAPGGSTDVTARALADAAARVLGQPIEIENRTGGGGSVMTTAIVNARPDGYTLGVVTPTAVAIAPNMRPDIMYDPLTDITPVLQYATFPMVIAVRSDSPYQTLEELIAAVKDQPHVVTYGTSGAGSVGQLIMEQISDVIGGFSMTHVPFQGGGAALAAVLGGHVSVLVAAEYAPQVQSGELRILSVLNDERLEAFPDIPTIGEQGHDVQLGIYGGVIAPKDIPDDVLATLADAFTQATEDEAFKQAIANFQMSIVVRDPDGFRELVAFSHGTYKTILDRLGLAKP